VYHILFVGGVVDVGKGNGRFKGALPVEGELDGGMGTQRGLGPLLRQAERY
jgi:hypothetical protein